MGWFSNLFGSPKQPELPAPTPAQLAELARDYEAVLLDEGASGKPEDYALSLTYVPPGPENIPANFKSPFLCGCCAVPTFLEARKCGLWVAKGLRASQVGRLVPVCAVCITYLNRHRSGQFTLPKGYDPVGQSLVERFPLDDLKRLALTRIAFVQAKVRSGR